jgi:hypothetical protein
VTAPCSAKAMRMTAAAAAGSEAVRRLGSKGSMRTLQSSRHRERKIAGVDLDRPTLLAIFAAAVLELAEQFLLLCVDRYHRLIVGVKRLDLGVAAPILSIL